MTSHASFVAIDLHQHQIGAAGESPVGDVLHLPRVRTVDEAVGVERRRHVLPDRAAAAASSADVM